MHAHPMKRNKDAWGTHCVQRINFLGFNITKWPQMSVSKKGIISIEKYLNPFLKIVDKNETKIRDNEDTHKKLRA